MNGNIASRGRPGSEMVVLLSVFLFFGGCGGGGTERTAPASQKDYHTFDAYLAEAGGRSTSAHQVVLIGIDGAAWHYLNRLIDEGQTPNLERIKNEGAYGHLRSVPCYVSPPAWISMLSGYLPAKTGVYTFGQWIREEKKFKGVNATDVRAPSVWDVASFAGKKTAVTNVPVTYPVRSENGIMVSGLLTPIGVEDMVALRQVQRPPAITLADVAPDVRSYSQPRRMVTADSLNVVVWWRIDSTDDGQTNYDRVVLRTFSRYDPSKNEPDRLCVFDVGDYSPWTRIQIMEDGKPVDAWFKLTLFQRPDGRFESRWSQSLLDVRETAPNYTYPADLADELAARFGFYLPSKYLRQFVMPSLARDAAGYADYFYDYDDWDLFCFVFTQADVIQHQEGFSERTSEVYQAIDRFLGDLIEKMPDESTLIITSDHGFNAFEYGVDLNRFFEGMGLLRRVPGSDEIDYDRTMVFHNMWFLYFNHELITRENLTARGIEIGDSEVPVEAFARYLQGLGGRLTYDEGAVPLPLEFTRTYDDVNGDDPDMIVRGTGGKYVVEFWNINRNHDTAVWPLAPTEVHNHERDGVFLVWGKHVKKGFDAGTRAIENIAPTMLYLLGLPVARDMDGQVMLDLFEPAFTAKNAVFTVPDYKDIPREFIAVDEDKEDLEKKLRSLGYAQ